MGQERQTRKRDRRSKLTEEDVSQIKAHLQQGKNPAILARYFEVSKSTKGTRNVGPKITPGCCVGRKRPWGAGEGTGHAAPAEFSRHE
jgi:hypothetical protein